MGFLTTAASIAILLGPAMGIQAATNILIKQTLVAHKPLKSEMPAGLTACGHHKKFTVLSGDHITLDDGTVLILRGIKAPEYWPVSAPYKSWPYGAKAKSALTQYLAGHPITLYCGKKKLTHAGEKIVHLMRDDNDWVQYWLVEKGHVYSFPVAGVAAGSASLWQSEKRARQQERGLWKKPSLSVVTATGKNLKPGWFQIVTGKVTTARKVRKNIYLNFGADWRKDFTVQIGARSARTFRKQGIDPLSLQGKTIEVRGFMEWSAGPKIIITHSEQIFLGEK
ncbi:MAG: thermonuclease family protein [Kordiimonadaceae bacterium]|nr:thermonuclease family protein [Kordiimonadaceae bacterium]